MKKHLIVYNPTIKTISFFLLAASGLFWGCGNGNSKNSIEASGNIETTDVVVSSKVNGDVLHIIKDEGSKVSTGDTIMILDHENLDYQLNQALAGVDFAKAQLELIKIGARKEDIQQGEDALKQAQINLGLAKQNNDRMTKYESPWPN